MSIIRVTKQKNFSIISNVALNDEHLSLKAKGLWAYLLSKPDNWEVRVSHLVKTCRDGRDSIYSTLRELKEFGYVEVIKHKDAHGKFTNYEYLVNEEPKPLINHYSIAEKPVMDNPVMDNPDVEKPTLIITDRIPLKTDFIKNERQPSAVFSKDSKDSLQELINLLPARHQTSHIIKLFITTALAQHSFDDIKASILYTRDKSKGNATQFKSYLGKCLDNKWYSGHLEAIEEERIQEERLKAEKLLKELTERQEAIEKEKQEKIEREKQEQQEIIFNEIDKDALDNFIKTELWNSLTAFEKKQFKNNRNLLRRLKYKLYLKTV